jgi:hypothetical protein
MSVAEVANFAALFVVSLMFPVLPADGAGLAYLVFAVMGVISFAIVFFAVPELKGRSLEGIESGIRSGSVVAGPAPDR